MSNTQGKDKLVVIGNGMAGMACLANILRHEKPFDITVFGEETYVNYNRIGLSSMLAGEKTEEDLVLNTHQWYEENGIALRLGEKVLRIDRRGQKLLTDAGREVPYDRLLLATGSRPFIPNIKGTRLSGVFAFRTMDDTKAMLREAAGGQRAVVIGGGLLGLEAARGLQQQGMAVSVVHLGSYLMDQQLDPKGGEILLRAIKQLGINVVLGAQTQELTGKHNVEQVHLAGGKTLPADMVVIACGIRPRVGLARDSGMMVNKGVVVDDFMGTSDPNIFAVGECVEHRGTTYGLVAPLYEQARVVAASLVGQSGPAYKGSLTATSLKVAGVNVFCAGEVNAGRKHEVVKYEDYHAGIYKRLLIRNDKLEGVILLGDLTGANQLTDLIKNGDRLGSKRQELLLGKLDGGGVDVLSCPDDALICGCMGVTKATLVEAITGKGVTDFQDLKNCTKASSGCGSCAPQVKTLLKANAGSGYVEQQRETICGCYEFSLQQLRTIAQTQKIKSVDELARVYAMRPEGCAVCKPALAYMLEELWCGEHEESRAHRFINDRVHGNIQKDGRFSVVPRMRGGVTSPEELMRIAQVAIKYEVPMVKVTGSQRLDLLGVNKEDLPAIWEELGMPSGHAYAKAVRMVKTCVGSRFCRYGTQDAIATGIELESRLENLYTPAKVKMAVVGCPRNCAEATVKDIGLVGVEGGWQVVIGGAAGKGVRKADDLCFRVTEEEALDAAMLFFQYYRENANYLERTYDFVERLGLDAIRAMTVEAPKEEQEKLRLRLAKSKETAVDPWLERRTPKTQTQFDTLKGEVVPQEVQA